MHYPQSERTIIKHKYCYKGIKYINDLGYPCRYRVVDEKGKDTGKIVIYYGGRFIAEVFKQLK